MRYTYKVRDLRPGEGMVLAELATVPDESTRCAAERYAADFAVMHPELDPVMLQLDYTVTAWYVPAPPVPAKKGRGDAR